jgi:hypothetical protein
MKVEYNNLYTHFIFVKLKVMIENTKYLSKIISKPSVKNNRNVMR